MGGRVSGAMKKFKFHSDEWQAEIRQRGLAIIGHDWIKDDAGNLVFAIVVREPADTTEETKQTARLGQRGE